MKTAQQISESVLARTGEGLLTGNFDLFGKCFLLPQTLNTLHGQRLISTLDDVRDIFDAVRLHHRKLGITDLVRSCKSAIFRDVDTVLSMHETRLLRGAIMVQQPFAALSTLKRIDGDWKVAQADYAVGNSPEMDAALLGRLESSAMSH